MGPKTVVIGPGQTRLDGYFSRFKRPEGAITPPLKSVSRESGTSVPSAQHKRPQPSQSPPYRSTSPPQQAQVSEMQPLSPHTQKQTPRRLSTQAFVLSPKRPRAEYEADDDDDDDDDDEVEMIAVGAPPRKSPRSSPQPTLSHRADEFVRSESHSSALSTLRSTPPDSSLAEVYAASREQSTTPRPTQSHIQQQGPSYTVRPTTSTSNASGLNSSFASSLTPAPTSSLRVIKNGVEQVRNSDSEGSDELEDLEDILGFGKPATEPSSPLTDLTGTPTPPPDELPRRSSRSTRGATSMQAREECPPPRGSSIKSDLSALLAGARKIKQAKANVQSNLKALESLQYSDDDLPQTLAGRNEQIEAILKATGREDDTARFMQAINRTDALVQEKTWFFFDRSQFRKPRRTPAYSELDCGGHPAEAFLRSEEQIKDALVCGYFQQSTMSARLPGTMSYWVFQHALYDKEADIRASCLDALSPGLMDVSGPEINHWIRSELKQMGMRDKVTGWDNAPALPEQSRGLNKLEQTTNWSGLQQILRIISTLAPTLTKEAVIENVCTLVRMAIDSSLTDHQENQHLLSVALGSCFDRLHDQKDSQKIIDEALAAVYSQTDDDEFRLRILEALPQSDFTAALARRKLAIAWFYNDCSLFAISSEYNDPQAMADSALLNLEIVQAHIEGQDDIFKIKRTTDYALLKFKLETLATGLGDGDQLALTQRHALAEDKKDLEAAVLAHNRLADAIADKTAKMHAKIVDKGTSHVARTVVKELLERLRSKLLYVVRTKPPPRRDIWTRQRDANLLDYVTVQAKPAEDTTLAEEPVVHYEPVVLKPKPIGRVQLFKRKQ